MTPNPERQTYRISVGEPYPRRLPPYMVDGGILEYSPGFHLTLVFGDLSPKEIEMSRRDPIEFGLFEINGVIFLLWRLGRIDGSSPYSWQLEPVKLDDTPLAATAHALVTVVVVDRTTLIVQALRAVSWSPEFTRAMDAAIRRQAAGGVQPDGFKVRTEYTEAVLAVYERYSGPAMWMAATARCRGGE